MKDFINPLYRNRFDYTIEIIAILSTLACFIPVILANRLDEGTPVPTHFNLYGEVDSWGDTSSFWMPAILALIGFIILSISERFYKKYNYPINISENNASDLYRLGVRITRVTKVMITLLFAYINNSTFAMAVGYECRSFRYIIILSSPVIITVIIVYIVKMFRLKD